MSRELVDRILGAGLVEVHVRELMERVWGVLTPSQVEQVKLSTRQQFTSFVEDIDRLVQRAAEEDPPEVQVDLRERGCVPMTDNPQRAAFDLRLVGHWVGNEGADGE